MEDNLKARIEKEIEKLNIILENYKQLQKVSSNILSNIFHRRIMNLEDDIINYYFILKGISLADKWQDCYLDDLRNYKQ